MGSASQYFAWDFVVKFGAAAFAAAAFGAAASAAAAYAAAVSAAAALAAAAARCFAWSLLLPLMLPAALQ